MTAAFVGALSAEDLARAMYEDMRSSYKTEHRRPPAWEELRAHPSWDWEPPGRGSYSTYSSMSDQWMDQAKRILRRLADS